MSRPTSTTRIRPFVKGSQRWAEPRQSRCKPVPRRRRSCSASAMHTSWSKRDTFGSKAPWRRGARNTKDWSISARALRSSSGSDMRDLSPKTKRFRMPTHRRTPCRIKIRCRCRVGSARFVGPVLGCGNCVQTAYRGGGSSARVYGKVTDERRAAVIYRGGQRPSSAEVVPGQTRPLPADPACRSRP